MYKLIKPLLFLLFPPEAAHHLIISLLKITRYIPLSNRILRWFYTCKAPHLEREVLGIKFPNPVGLAAGFDKNAEVYNELSDLGFGFVEIGSVTPLPQKGNPGPRCFRLPEDRALINRMGINNVGMVEAVKNLQSRKHRIIIGGNISKNAQTPQNQAAADYEKAFARMYDYVDFFTLNVSCPNVKNLTKLQEIDSLSVIVDRLIHLRQYYDDYRPILLKISPDVEASKLEELIELVLISGLDGVVVVNTTTRRDGLVTSPKTIEAIGNGGLSGAPLTQRSLAAVRAIHQKAPDLPIIGVGGIMTPQDALNMLEAGASLVEVYTGMIYEGPGFAKSILKHLKKNLK